MTFNLSALVSVLSALIPAVEDLLNTQKHTIDQPTQAAHAANLAVAKAAVAAMRSGPLAPVSYPHDWFPMAGGSNPYGQPFMHQVVDAAPAPAPGVDQELHDTLLEILHRPQNIASPTVAPVADLAAHTDHPQSDPATDAADEEDAGV